MNRELRIEIQALRAVAVATVVVCHFWTDALPGGFVGVDVFFVISGFLITSHLLREVERTGTVGLAGFWARRARRILPAALLVLLVCALGTLAWVSEVHSPQFFAEIRASALYVENWQLAASAVDYFAQSDAPSPVQHFWSLSAEEQFYIVWPVLIIAAVAVKRGLIGYVLGAVTLASLAYSIFLTDTDPAAAYFVTPTRAWEFGAGGLLALMRPSDAMPHVRAAAAWLGLAAIGVASVFYSAETPFPGIAAALPVLGALAVIWARAPGVVWAPTRAYAPRPIQFVGDISYSVYLWHWPLLVFAPYVVAGGVPRGILVVLTLVLAAVTKRLVEDPIRRGKPLVRRRPRWTFATALVGTGLVLVTAAQGSAEVKREIQVAEKRSQAIVAANPKCFGAAARDPDKPCENPKLRLTVVPTPAEAHQRRNFPCGLVEERGYLYVCSFGVPKSKATATVALIGDSHAAHWRAAMDTVAKEQKWYGYSLSHTGCPLSSNVHTSLKGANERKECKGWNQQVQRYLRSHPEIKTVIVSAIAGGVRDRETNAAGGYVAAWKALPASVQRIVVIRDTPKVRGATDECVAAAMRSSKRAGPACKVARNQAMAPDQQVVAAKRIKDREVDVVDMTRFICDKRWCYPVVGGVLVFKDQNHITEVFGRTLGPYLSRAFASSARS